MKIVAIIPARYNSTRFPAKLMQQLGQHTVITTTYKAAISTQLFDDVYVVTDSELIFEEIKAHGGKVVMSSNEHESGSDRIAEALQFVEADVIINIQGDEPFIQKEPLAAMCRAFIEDISNEIDLVSLMRVITNKEEIENPNHVKVVVDEQQMALYFSRSVIPHNRDGIDNVTYYQHIGVYGYRRQTLLDFSIWKPSSLEMIEKLEQLRYLEHGKKIKMITTSLATIGIDTPEDLEKAKQYLHQNPLLS